MIMLSGDNQLVADAIAKETGLTDAWGNLLPEQKVAAINKLKISEGKVAMVGDGVNDAPAMANSTVGIAMGAAGSRPSLRPLDGERRELSAKLGPYRPRDCVIISAADGDAAWGVVADVIALLLSPWIASLALAMTEFLERSLPATAVIASASEAIQGPHERCRSLQPTDTCRPDLLYDNVRSCGVSAARTQG